MARRARGEAMGNYLLPSLHLYGADHATAVAANSELSGRIRIAAS
jgi:hypothetical protein